MSEHMNIMHTLKLIFVENITRHFSCDIRADKALECRFWKDNPPSSRQNKEYSDNTLCVVIILKDADIVICGYDGFVFPLCDPDCFEQALSAVIKIWIRSLRDQNNRLHEEIAKTKQAANYAARIGRETDASIQNACASRPQLPQS